MRQLPPFLANRSVPAAVPASWPREALRPESPAGYSQPPQSVDPNALEAPPPPNNGKGAVTPWNSTQAGQVLRQKLDRRYLLIVNTGTSTIYVGLDSPALSAAAGGIPITAGGSYELAEFVLTNAIYLSPGQALAVEA